MESKLQKYKKELFRPMPWRDNTNPYYILVSEVMLQQTQVDRVMPKFEAFIEAFPTLLELANAEFANVLKQWSGLGYNRRAKWLHQTAQIVVKDYSGKVPDNVEELVQLPGIGPNTAAAIVVYAYNKPEVFIETNIRTVFIHHYFKDRDDVHDKEIISLLEEKIPKVSPRQWYWAIMDYGTDLKKKHGNVSQRSKHYAKQSKFQGSNRQIRGAILRCFSEHDSVSVASILCDLDFEDKRIERNINNLIKDGLLIRDKNQIAISK